MHHRPHNYCRTIYNKKPVLATLAMAIEKLGPVQLRITVGDDVRQQMNWLAERRLLQQPNVPSVSDAVQLDCAARFAGWIPTEVQCKHRTSVCLYM